MTVIPLANGGEHTAGGVILDHIDSVAGDP